MGAMISEEQDEMAVLKKEVESLKGAVRELQRENELLKNRGVSLHLIREARGNGPNSRRRK